VFLFPTRLIVAILLGCLVVGGSFCTIDLWAQNLGMNIDKAETDYSNTASAFGARVFPPGGPAQKVVNPYLADGNGLMPGRSARPPFHTKDPDCACSLLDEAGVIYYAVMDPYGELLIDEYLGSNFESDYTISASCGANRVMIHGICQCADGFDDTTTEECLVSEWGKSCPANEVISNCGSCECTDGFVPNSDGQCAATASPYSGSCKMWAQSVLFNGACVCADGFDWTADFSACVENAAGKLCAQNAVFARKTPSDEITCHCIDGLSFHDGECINPCPPGSSLDEYYGDGCYCKDGYILVEDSCVELTEEYVIAHIMQELGKDRVGRLVKCSVESLRMLYEPLPFCIRYAGIISVAVAALSIVLFVCDFRTRALQLRELVGLQHLSHLSHLQQSYAYQPFHRQAKNSFVIGGNAFRRAERLPERPHSSF
jgi:hypothetical protein